MDILTPVNYTHVRFATEEEKEREWYFVKDGMINSSRIAYTRLAQNYTITLAEARDIYNRIVAKNNLKEGEEIKSLKIDLTEYHEYNDNGEPKYASEEYPVDHDPGTEKKATYNPKYNRLIIWEAGYPVYQNWDGVITTDKDALADTYL